MQQRERVHLTRNTERADTSTAAAAGVSWYRERRFNRFFYRISLAIGGRLSRTVNHLGARLVARMLHWLLPQSIATIRRNLAPVLRLPQEAKQAKAAAKRLLANFFSYQIDFLKACHLFPKSTAFLDDIIAFGPKELAPVRALLAKGKGIILVTGHFGGWEIGGLTLCRHNLPVTLVSYREPKGVEELKKLLRTRTGIQTITIGRRRFQAIRILRALKANEIVAVHMDRPVTKNVQPARLFGKEATFSKDAVTLARITGAPMLPCFITMDVNTKRYGALFGNPMYVDKHQEEAAMHTLINLYKDMLVRYHEQWYNFYPFFKAERC